MAGETLTVEELRSMLTEALRPGNSSAPPASTAAPAAASAPAAGLPTAGLVTALIEAIGKLTTAITGSKPAEVFSETTQIATSLGGLKNASDLATGAISRLAGEVPVLGAVLKKAGLDINEELKIARAGNQTGVGQGNASELRERALAAGFKSVQDYIDYLRSSYGNSLRTIGRTAEDSSQKLGEVAARAAESSEGQNLLKKNLITPEQLAQIAGIAAEGKSAMLQDAAGRQALAEETAKLAAKMDAQTKVTGETIDQQIQSRKASQESVDEQFRLQSLANDQQRMQYSQNKQLLKGQGQAMQDVTSTIYAGGRLSREQQQLLQAATGGRAGQYIQAVREQKRTSGLAADDPRRIEANRRLETIVANMSAYQASPEFARRAQTTSNADQIRAFRTLQEQNTEKYPIRNIMRESGVTPAEAKRRAEEFGLQQGRGFRQEPLYNKTQEPNVGARPYELLAEANEQARKTAVGLATELKNQITALGKNTEALDKVREGLNLVAGPKGQTQEQRTQMVKDYFNSSTENKGQLPGTGVTGQPIQTSNMNVQANGPVTVTPTTATNPNEAKPTTPATAPVTAPPQASRGKGTYGETGATAEIKDVVAQLHKGETVFTPDQRENMIKDSANAAFDKILGKKNKDSADQNVQYKNVDKNDPEFVKMRQDNEAERAERAKFMRSREVADPMYAGGKRFETYDIREEEAKLNEIKTPKIDTSYASQAEKMLGEQTQGVFGNLRTAFAKRQQQMGPNITDEFKNYQPKSVTAPPVEQPAPQINTPKIESRETVTIKDLNDQLMMLNKSIAQLVQSSTATSTFAEQQIRVTKKLSGNRFG